MRCSRSSAASRARAAGGSRSSARQRVSRPVRAVGMRAFGSAKRRCCPRDVLARGPSDPQGAAVGVARDEGGIPAAGRRCGRCRRSAPRVELDEVSEPWRGNQPERGFSMAIDDLYVPGTVFAVAEDEDGGSEVSSISLPACWRRLVAEHDAAQLGDAERPHGVPRRRDGRVGPRDGRRRALAQLLRADRLPRPERARTVLRRIVRRGILLADSVFQLERLYSFNRKFFPEWRRALPLRRAAHRPARCRSRVPPRRVAARAAPAVARRREAVTAWPPSVAVPTDDDAEPRAPVGDRTGDGASRLRLLPRGAQADRPPSGPLGGGATRRRREKGVGSSRAARIFVSCSTSSARRS